MNVNRTLATPRVATLLTLLLVALAASACDDDDGATGVGTAGDDRTRRDAGSADGRDDGTLDGGGSDNGIGDDGGGAIPGTAGSVRGVVWAPGNAPGSVPADHEIPVHDAVVSLSRTPPAPIPQRAYCEGCEELPEEATFSDHAGAFLLEGVVPDTYWLVIQKGQFRLEQQVVIEAGQTLALEADRTTLPSQHDPGAGLWVPHIAIALGNYDHLEDIFGKMGMGEVDRYGEFVPDLAPEHIDIWDNGGAASNVAVEGTLTQLVSDLDRMLDYHIIFIPCAADFNVAALLQQNVLRNLRDYVAQGGKLYVTDWSGEWMDAVFPAQVELAGSGIDTPASAYEASSGSWDTDQFGTGNGQPYDSYNGTAVDDDLATWLTGQTGPTPFAAEASTWDAADFDIQGAWNVIDSVHSVTIGTADDGSPLVDEPHVYVVAGTEDAPEPQRPMTVTFEPVGCGRVLYSTYHTTDVAHDGLTPQERILLYLIMEIGVCKGGKEFFE